MPEQLQKEYELICILSPQLEGTDLENTKKEIEGIINKFEGKISFKEEKKHNLAYPINKQGQGIYLISQISINPEKIPDFSKELKLNKQVLRHLISQITVLKPKIKKERPEPSLVKATAGKKIIKKPKPKVEEKTSLKEIDKKLEEIIKEI